MAEELERIKWNEALGNPYLVRIYPDMLLESGYEIEKECRLKTDERHLGSNKRIIIYDKSYVEAKLQAELSFLARHTTFFSFIKLFIDVWIHADDNSRSIHASDFSKLECEFATRRSQDEE